MFTFLRLFLFDFLFFSFVLFVLFGLFFLKKYPKIKYCWISLLKKPKNNRLLHKLYFIQQDSLNLLNRNCNYLEASERKIELFEACDFYCAFTYLVLHDCACFSPYVEIGTS